MFGAGVAGLALEQAIPFGRVWSFPSKIVTYDQYNRRIVVGGADYGFPDASSISISWFDHAGHHWYWIAPDRSVLFVDREAFDTTAWSRKYLKSLTPSSPSKSCSPAVRHGSRR